VIWRKGFVSGIMLPIRHMPSTEFRRPPHHFQIPEEAPERPHKLSVEELAFLAKLKAASLKVIHPFHFKVYFSTGP
jgi:hypothetical protein